MIQRIHPDFDQYYICNKPTNNKSLLEMGNFEGTYELD